MILLDTNVLSELAKATPSSHVVNWLDAQDVQTLYLSSVTVAEILFGISILPGGKRKSQIEHSMKRTIALFENRMLVFDVEAASHYARLAAKARQQGLGFPTPDGYIAAIAATHNMSVATRDTAPFMAADIPIFNPWTAPC